MILSRANSVLSTSETEGGITYIAIHISGSDVAISVIVFLIHLYGQISYVSENRSDMAVCMDTATKKQHIISLVHLTLRLIFNSTLVKQRS